MKEKIYSLLYVPLFLGFILITGCTETKAPTAANAGQQSLLKSSDADDDGRINFQFVSVSRNIAQGAMDILPMIGKRITFVSARQDYKHLDGEPGLKLPGFALIIELAKPAEGGDIFKMFFQTLTAILNIHEMYDFTVASKHLLTEGITTHHLAEEAAISSIARSQFFGIGAA